MGKKLLLQFKNQLKNKENKMKTFQQFLLDINEAVIEYITGDRSSPNYDPSHGGSNYHDHLGFKDPETRIAAQKFLQSRGWQIGSTTGGRHATGSLHYAKGGQAFDVPMYGSDGVQFGFSDDQKGEEALSRKLRADLASGGFTGAGIGSGETSSSSGSSKPSKGSLDKPEPTRVLAKLKGKSGELNKKTGEFTERGWSKPEGKRYKDYGGKE